MKVDLSTELVESFTQALDVLKNEHNGSFPGNSFADVIASALDGFTKEHIQLNDHEAHNEITLSSSANNQLHPGVYL